jgi:hypothetical protein
MLSTACCSSGLASISRQSKPLDWSAIHGRTDPVLGWYSPAFDERHASTTLVGSGRFERGHNYRSVLSFHC